MIQQKKTFRVSKRSYLDGKNEYARHYRPIEHADFYVDEGIWYRFARFHKGQAVFEECSEDDVPQALKEQALQLYPGALKS